jgi:hypothetical protein
MSTHHILFLYFIKETAAGFFRQLFLYLSVLNTFVAV